MPERMYKTYLSEQGTTIDAKFVIDLSQALCELSVAIDASATS